MDIETFALAKKYTDESLLGGGAVAGKNCIIEDITDITGGQRITFKYTLDDGTVKTRTMDVMNGVDGEKGETGATGKGIKAVAVDANNHLIVTYTDDTTTDAGEIDVTDDTKADKVQQATAGHLASLDSSGNLNDSGKTAADFFENAYADKIFNSVYARLGRSFNNPEGYLRSGKKLNKIVVLGNSLTGIEYTYTRQNGEEFSEQRELGCCNSENQWICSVYRYLKANVNPDVKIYSAQCADWERDTAGNRQLSTVLGKNCYIAQDTVKVPTGGTLADYLTDDTDIVIVDLYENISVGN